MTDLITQPGVYDMLADRYHSQCCNGPSISSTGLRKIRLGSPAHFWATSDLNPNAFPSPRTKALNFGNAAHSILLEGALPEDQYAVCPFDGPMNRNEDGWKAGEKQDWKKQQEDAGLIVVTRADLEVIEQMYDAIRAHPMVRDGIFSGEIERSIFWKSEDVWLKARPDVLPTDTLIVDYKAVADASPRAVARSVIDYGYHMQLALAIEGIREATGRRVEEAALVCQEKTPPYLVQVYPLSDSLLAVGKLEYEIALETFKECLRTGEWPGYAETTIFLPDWKVEALKHEGLNV